MNDRNRRVCIRCGINAALHPMVICRKCYDTVRSADASRRPPSPAPNAAQFYRRIAK